jgi:hypothetical protein
MAASNPGSSFGSEAAGSPRFKRLAAETTSRSSGVRFADDGFWQASLKINY